MNFEPKKDQQYGKKPNQGTNPQQTPNDKNGKNQQQDPREKEGCDNNNRPGRCG